MTMGNLIAEKRVDKNGVLTTKHVRAGAKSTETKTPMPAPKLGAKKNEPTYKAPTAAQLKRSQRTFTASVENPDPQLLEALGLPPTNEVGIYRFSASTSEMYEMMARISTGNTLAMMQAGYKSVTDAMEFLDNHGMSHLEEPRSMALEAQERRIPIEDFIRETRDAPLERMNSPYFMDYMEVTGIAALSEFDELPGDIYHGRVKLADLRAIGVTRIGKSIGWEVTQDALRKMADGTANYDSNDMKQLLDLFGDASDSYLNSGLELTGRYGIDFTKSITNPNLYLLEAESRMIEKGTDPERIKSLLKYRDDFINESRYVIVPFTDEGMERFHDMNVSAADAASGRITLTQLDAIEDHGISPSISGGWL
jgi:hypothetical protein